MRIGYTRSARLIDLMERRGIVGPYIGSQPNELLIKEINLLTDELKKHEQPLERKERNAPKVEKALEPEQPEISDDEGLTPKQRIFIAEYLRDFNDITDFIDFGQEELVIKNKKGEVQ
jgi:hypothetical protein